MSDKWLDFGLVDIDDLQLEMQFEETMDEMCVDTWELKTDLAGVEYYESRATRRRLSKKDFEMWKPSMTPSKKTCTQGGKNHEWQVDYISPFTAQKFESCKLCKIKREE